VNTVERNNIGKMVDVFKRGDIILCDLGLGEGSEQSGQRPCVVIQNDVGNKFSTTIIVATITSSNRKAKIPTHVEVDERSGLDKPSLILCEQVRTVDKHRVKKYIGSVPRNVREKIDNALIISLEIFKRGELEVEEQVIKVKSLEETILDLANLTLTSKVTNHMVSKFNRELMILEDLCKENRLYLNGYYNKSKELDKIINAANVKREPMLKVV